MKCMNLDFGVVNFRTPGFPPTFVMGPCIEGPLAERFPSNLKSWIRHCLALHYKMAMKAHIANEYC